MTRRGSLACVTSVPVWQLSLFVFPFVQHAARTRRACGFDSLVHITACLLLFPFFMLQEGMLFPYPALSTERSRKASSPSSQLARIASRERACRPSIWPRRMRNSHAQSHGKVQQALHVMHVFDFICGETRGSLLWLQYPATGGASASRPTYPSYQVQLWPSLHAVFLWKHTSASLLHVSLFLVADQ